MSEGGKKRGLRGSLKEKETNVRKKKAKELNAGIPFIPLSSLIYLDISLLLISK